MPEVTDLLGSLKINRDQPPPAKSGKGLLLLTTIVVSVISGFVFATQWVDDEKTAAMEEEIAASPAVQATTASASTRTEQPERQFAKSVLDASGYVVARKAATVSSKFTAKVLEVLIEEGDYVEEGQLLARLDDHLARAQVQLEEARLLVAKSNQRESEVRLRQAQLDLQRIEKLGAKGVISEVDLEQAQNLVEVLEVQNTSTKYDVGIIESQLKIQRQLLLDTEIRAPFSGMITYKSAQPGEMISPIGNGGFTRTGVGTIVDMNSLEIEVDVNESNINRVFTGQKVSARLNAYPKLPFDAEVIKIVPIASRSQGTVRVRVKILIEDNRILPDMGVRVSFNEEKSSS